MDRPRIALVCRDDALRITAAEAFDDAPPDWDVTLHRAAPSDADVVVAVGDPGVGDVDLDPSNPHDVLDRVGSVLETRRSRVVAVVGASGGCGATSIALHLAAQARGAACVLDMHERPSCAHRIGIERDELEQAAGAVPTSGGFKLMWAAGSTGTQSIDDLRASFDLVIADVPADAVPGVAGSCNAVVLVLQPTVGSASRAADMLDALDDPAVAVVTNRLGPGGETTRAELQRILGCRISLELPCSPGLRDSEDDSRLLTSEWSPWLRRVRRLSFALSR